MNQIATATITLERAFGTLAATPNQFISPIQFKPQRVLAFIIRRIFSVIRTQRLSPGWRLLIIVAEVNLE